MEDSKFQSAVFNLKSCLREAPNDQAVSTILTAKERVLERYGKLFNPSNLEFLTADEYRGFLRIENNRHWSQLYRAGDQAANDMEVLRHGLSILLDENQPIGERFNSVKVRGLGKAIKSSILLVAYPDRYGVWNNISEQGLKRFGLFPVIYPKKDKGKTYAAINECLTKLAEAIVTDLWTLDSLWWRLSPDRSEKLIKQLSSLQ